MCAQGLLSQCLAWCCISGLPLFGADVFSALLITAQGLDAAKPRSPWGVEDLKHQFIGQEGVGRRGFLAASRHRGFEVEISFQASDLTVGGIGVVLHPQQLFPEQSPPDGGGIEAAIADEPAAVICFKPSLVQQRWIARSLEIHAFHLPEPFKPVGVEQIVPIRGPRQRRRQAPVGPAVQPLFQAALGPGRPAAEQDGEADQQYPHAPFHV